MSDSQFNAESFVKSSIADGGRNIELEFIDSNGNTHTISSPSHVIIALIPVLTEHATKTQFQDGMPQFQKNVTKWAVGRSNEASLVLLIANDELPLAFRVEDANKLWQEIREECDIVSNRPPPTRM